MKAVTIALLALSLAFLAPAAAAAEVSPRPCFDEPDLQWCPPPYFGPYSLTVCNVTFDFVCMQW